MNKLARVILWFCLLPVLGMLAYGVQFDLAQTLSDGAQRTTLAFAGLGMMTGNLQAQSFFPPGKVADYTGFQYLRDNDPDNMGHNTSFLTRVANNVIYILTDDQFAQLKTLAVAQIDQINQYGYKRYPFMKAYRRLLENDVPAGSIGLDLDAVKQASRELYLLDGQISFDRALLYANVIRSMNATQLAYLDAMKGHGWNSWPNITNDQIRSKMQGLPQGTAVAVMTYAGDLFSWYAGSIDADVYFCPERHGTYYGSFYMKDAPAIGHEGYSINEQLTATAGAALCDSAKGYVTPAQAAAISSLVDTQRSNLYAGATNIVQIRTQIATLLRSLLTSTANSDAVEAQVLDLSATYGELDGENNYHYATVFAQVYATLTPEQKTHLMELRHSILSGTYTDGTPFDFTTCNTYYLYSQVIPDPSVLTPYIGNTDYLFAFGTPPTASFTFAPNAPIIGQTVTFTDTSTGAPTSWAWTFGDGTSSAVQNPTHAYSLAGSYSVTLQATNAAGSGSLTQTVAVTSTSKPDLWVRTPAETVYSGDNVYSTNGLTQKKALTVPANATAMYLLRVQNDGNTGDNFLLTGSAGATGWSIFYKRTDNNADITAAVTGAGWNTGPLAPGAQVGIYVQVVPWFTLPAGAGKVVLITATSTSDATKVDVVKTVTTVDTRIQPDLWIRKSPEAAFIGNNIYNNDGSNQARTATVPAYTSVIYAFHIQNDGNTADSFTVIGPAGGSGWSVQYYTNAGVNITTAITGSGWNPGMLNAGTDVGFYVRVMPTTAAPGTVNSIVLTAASTKDATKRDAVKAVTTVGSRNSTDQ